MAEEKKTMSRRLNGLKDEFRKIVWEEPEKVGKQSAVVIVISVILAILIAVIDLALKTGVDYLTNL